MDLDDARPQPARRASSAHDRPSRAPHGPRIRTRPKHSLDISSSYSPGPLSADGPASPLFSSTASLRPDSPTVDPTAHSIDASLAHPFPAPPLPPPSPPAHADAAAQAPTPPSPSESPSLLEPSPTPSPAPPTPAPTSAPTHTPKPTTAPPKVTPATFIPPPPLTPPPTITFDSTPIPWKGLPLEAAQWTFSSSELQEIVSRAIRLSARESFVRLLSLQALEVDIVQETERLNTERVSAQAKWRFEVGRRTMLMQALNSSVASSVPNGNGTGARAGENEGVNPISGFVGQLASSIASCDSLLASILHSSDQQSQISLIQHQHWASALGVALSKLNRAYERQEQELRRAQARVQTLEDELEEAWREAEKMAIDFDDLEQEVAASTQDGSEGVDALLEEDIELDVCAGAGAGAEGYGAAPGPYLEVRQDPDETGTLGDATINTEVAVVLGVTATAVASKATLVNSPSTPKFTDKSDTKSVRSVKSTRSRRSTRDGPIHVSRLSAARMRSRTASNASLRLPKALRSALSTRSSPVDAPPIPGLPQGYSFLDMDSLAHEQVRKALPPPRYPEPTLALPTPPHSAGLQPTRVPSIWLETDGGKSTPLNGLDRMHSLQIFSSLMARTPRKTRRSNLVMSLTGSDRSSMGSPVESGAGSSGSSMGMSMGMGMGTGTSGTTTSPTSNSSPVSLPTHALAHFRGPSLTSSRSIVDAMPRPGSAGARLTTTMDTLTPMPVATPRRSLVSRASSVILRRLSQATMGGSKAAGSGSGSGSGSKAASLVSPFSSPSRSREALRLSAGGSALERWREDGEGEGGGEVMLIGSPHAESFDG